MRWSNHDGQRELRSCRRPRADVGNSSAPMLALTCEKHGTAMRDNAKTRCRRGAQAPQSRAPGAAGGARLAAARRLRCLHGGDEEFSLSRKVAQDAPGRPCCAWTPNRDLGSISFRELEGTV